MWARMERSHPGPDADTIPWRPESLPNLCRVSLEDGINESPIHIRQKYINKKINK
jgi:hypothetical protein